MAKSRIGPFALEAPLAAPSGGSQIFRGLHLEQKRLAAIRVFPLPMGLTPESRQAYADQLEELKLLRHAGIVRCYGGGFDARRAFLAYEMVEGESLDASMERRGQLPWETALDYSRQAAEALEYAHEKSWIHERLGPSKVLISSAGIAKIADWRREAITSMLTSKISAEQLQYSAPELLRGEARTTKSDLYSLGAIMYFMLVGKPPFEGTDSEDLKQKILNDPAASVAAQVFDCPVWLDAIIAQLLSKDPASRPYSARALLLAFAEAEKRQSQGVGVLQHATAGFSPLQMNVDRDEAEKVLGIKPKKKKKKKAQHDSVFESPLVLVLCLVAALGGVTWFLWPPSEAQLVAEAKEYLASEDWQDWNEAQKRIELLLRRFPEGESASWATDRKQWIEARAMERELKRDQRFSKDDEWSQPKIQFVDARKYERFGDLATAIDKYRAIENLFADSEEDASIIYLTKEAIARIEEQGIDENALAELLTAKLAEAKAAYDSADVAEAKLRWQSIVELYDGNQEVASLVDEAKRSLVKLSDGAGEG